MQETGAKSPDVTQLKIKLVLGEEALGRQRTYCRVPFGRSFSVSLIIDCRAVSGFETVSMILPWKSEVEHAELTALHPYSKTIQLQPKQYIKTGGRKMRSVACHSSILINWTLAKPSPRLDTC